MAKGLVVEPEYIAKLTSALHQKLAQAEISHEHVSGDRYRFIVVSKQFNEMFHPDRQRIVWDIAEEALGKELFKVSMILTLGTDDLPQD